MDGVARSLIRCWRPAGHTLSMNETPSRKRVDWLLLVSLLVVLPAWLFGSLNHGQGSELLNRFVHACASIMGRVWWGLLLGAVAVGLLNQVPRRIVLNILGPGGSLKGLLRAVFAGLLLDLCNHGILAVGMKLYERGASLGQVIAFLVASPWNSLSLTLMLVGLVGWRWTLGFILLSLLVGMVSGLVFEGLVASGRLPENPNGLESAETSDRLTDRSPMLWMWHVLRDGWAGSRIVLRWALFGTLLAALIHAFVPDTSYARWFGPTLFGLIATTAAATLIEVCSEGSVPIAADLFHRAQAPGNAFTFLMAGAATDYTEILTLRDTVGSWRVALCLPLVTLPQVLLLSILLNQLPTG